MVVPIRLASRTRERGLAGARGMSALGAVRDIVDAPREAAGPAGLTPVAPLLHDRRLARLRYQNGPASTTIPSFRAPATGWPCGRCDGTLPLDIASGRLYSAVFLI